MGLSDDEIAFYDALAQNESAKDLLSDEILLEMTHVLVKRVKDNVTVVSLLKL